MRRLATEWTKRARTRGSTRLAGVACLAAAATSLLAASCGGQHPPPAPESGPTITARTRVAETRQVPISFGATGSIEPVARVGPGSKILGRVDAVLVEEGERTRAGQVLARLEKRDLEAAVDQARAAIGMAEAQLENARAQYSRMVELHRRGSVTEKSLEDATAGFRVAEAGVEQARANHAAARVNLGYAEIQAPVSGWVTAKRIEAGDMATPGVALFTIEDLSRVKVVLDVPESEVAGLREGDPAKVRIDVLDREWETEIVRIVPAGDPASRTYEVRLLLDNPDERLKAGMFVRAQFPRGAREALLVPRGALAVRGQLRGLYVVAEDGRALLRWVRVGRDFGDQVEILSGLDAGERYVVNPGPGLVDGSPVRES